ncbi:MAG: HAMP domain-containing protein [Spirochaetes bacterium]|nr:HAMP domain-containing protein [Spirochaetota bacterium]
MTPENAPSPARAPMPAWLRYALVAPLCLLVAGLAWLAWTKRDGMTLSALERRIPLRRPVSVTLDTRGTLYTLDDKYFRILGIDASGRAVSQRYVRPDDAEHYEYWSELAVDADGVLYATKVVYFLDTELVDYEEIDRYPPGGREEVLYTLDHDADEYAYDTRLLTLQVHDGHLYFDVRREEAVELWRVRLDGGAPQHVLDVAVPSADVYNLAGYDEAGLFVASYSGDRVFRLGPGGSLVDSDLHSARPGVPAYVLADKLFLDRDGRLLMSDLFNQCVYRAGKDGALEMLLSKEDLPDRPERALYKDVWVADDGRIAVVESIGGEAGRLVVFGPDGTVEREITAAVPSLALWLRQLAPWAALAGLVLAFAGTVVYVYLAVLNRRVALVLKLILAFVPLVALSIAFIANRIFTKTFEKVEEEVRFRLSALAQAAGRTIDGDAVDRIRVPSDFLGEDYTAIAAGLDALVNSGADPWNQRVFANITKLYNGMFYIMVDYASSYGVLYPMPHAPFERYLAALETGTPQQYEYTDADGTYLEAAVPVRNAAGKAVAVLYVGSSKDDLVLLRETFRAEVTRTTAIAVAALLLAIVAVSVFLLLSVNRLRGAVKRMADGELDAAVSIRSRDEIGDLGQGFNAMGRRLKGHFEETSSMSDAYARFVPREFLQLLGKERIAEVELKQNRLLNLTILFADIREFTSLSETMGPEDNFKFLNSYLSRMGPIIRNHHGFIDKYLGDGIMALFPGEPSDAVRAAVEMQQELYTYNPQRQRMNYPPIRVGIGVHSEKVILGIVGEKERMEGTVIGNAVNLASRLESLTKRYCARIIVSERIIATMSADAPDHRLLGHAEVKGIDGKVPVHEVFGADPPEDVRLKRHTKAFFEKGVRLFRQGDRAGAGRHFQAVAKAHPADRAAAYYVDACIRAATRSAEPETPGEA